MKLSTRITILIVATLTLFITVELVILNQIILPAYIKAEEQNGIKDMDRVLKALDNEISHLDRSVHDWGAWIDMANFIENREKTFIHENLDEVTFRSLEINYLGIFSIKGEKIWSLFLDRDLSPYAKTDLKLPLDHLIQPAIKFSHHGIISTKFGPMLIAARPVLRPNEKPVGTILMGQFLDDSLAHKISHQTNITASFKFPKEQQSNTSDLTKSIKQNNRIYLLEHQQKGQQISIQTVVNDITKTPAIIITIQHSSPLVQEGQNAFKTLMISILVITALTLFIVLLTIRFYLIKPINHLIRQVNKVEKKEVWSLSTNLLKRGDEVSTLATAFANMVDNLNEQRMDIEIKEKNYRYLVENANTIILCWNRKGEITLFNEFAQTFFGFTEQEILGKSVVGTIVPESETTGRDLSPLMDEICQNPVKFAQNINENMTKSGKRVWIAWTNKFYYNEKSGFDEVISIGMDITQRLAQEKQLETARAEAEQANEIKSLFLANMSHEIRTPMNGIIGMAQLLEQAPLAKENREQLSAIQTSANRLLTIINDILDFSKIEAGKLSLESQLFNFQESITDIQDMLALKANEKGLALNWYIDDAIPPGFIGDPYRLSQILINLVTNAIKFTRQGSVQVNIDCLPHPEEKETTILHIKIKDTGIGIPQEQQKNIFRAFRQADLSHSRKHGGSGLGLSISSQLVKLMDGEIGLESSSAQGSTFWFKVKLRSSKNRPVKKPDDFVLSQSLAGRRILLAEDEAINTLIAVTILELQQIEVTTVIDGQQAFNEVCQNKFDLILMDIQMPTMDGLVATQKIREREQGKGLPPIPIIAMTAHAVKGYREQCLAAGMNDYISKPFSNNELLLVVSRNMPL